MVALKLNENPIPAKFFDILENQQRKLIVSLLLSRSKIFNFQKT